MRLLLGICGLLLFVVPAGTYAQATESRAALVVDYGNGQVQEFCVTFTEESITGLELLRRAGLSVNLDQFGGLGAGVCKIGDTGCTTPGETCFCKCDGGACPHWTYFHGDGAGGWRASITGSSTYAVRDGMIEGWLWTDRGTLTPRAFSSVCAVAQADTPIPAHTNTVEPPTATPVPPTNTPIPPTNTPIPPTSTPRPVPTSTAIPPTTTTAPAPEPTATTAVVKPTTEPPTPTAETIVVLTPTTEPPTATSSPANTSTPEPTATTAPTETPLPSATASPTATTVAATNTPVAQATLSPTTVAAGAIEPTPEPGGRVETGIQGEEDLPRRIGTVFGIVIALLGILLWLRVRMAKLPPATPETRAQPKITYKMKGHERPDNAAQDEADGT